VQSSSLWQAVLGEIELSISRGNFITWFKNTTLLREQDDAITIGVPNVFIKQQLERKYNDLIVETLRKNGATPAHIDYKIHSVPSRNKIEDEPVVLTAQPSTEKRSSSGRPQANTLSHGYRQGINERYTFENFIVGSGNELAHAARH